MADKPTLLLVQIGVVEQIPQLLGDGRYHLGVSDEAFGREQLDSIIWAKTTEHDMVARLNNGGFTPLSSDLYHVDGYTTLRADVAPGPDHYNELLKALDRCLGADYTLDDAISERGG